MISPAWPFKARAEERPLLYDLRLKMLKARREPPKITPNLMAARLPVTIKERKPPRESSKPTKNMNTTNILKKVQRGKLTINIPSQYNRSHIIIRSFG